MQKITRTEEKSLLAILIKRTASFFFGLCLLSVFFYGVGTYQGFMDKTQDMLLEAGLMMGLASGLFSFYGCMFVGWLAFRRELRYIGDLGSYITLGFFGMLIAALASFIIVFTQGNRT